MCEGFELSQRICPRRRLLVGTLQHLVELFPVFGVPLAEPVRLSARQTIRGKKLARQRGVHEDHVAAFAVCIREAQLHGDELDKIYCFYE